MRAALIGALMLVCGCESDAPRSACGFRCTASGECPADYACRPDGRCYLNGAPADQSCVVDGGLDTDDPPPRVVNMTPRPNETGVALGARISVVFSEPVTGLDFTTFRLSAGEFHVPVSADILDDSSGEVATLVPSRPLREATLYQVNVEPGIRDGAFQTVVPTQWNFMTVTDQGPPSVISVSPMNGATNVDLTSPVVVEFSEEVRGVSPTSVYVSDPNGPMPTTIGYVSDTAVSLMTAVRQAHTSYSIHVTSPIADLVGNPLAGAPLAFSFVTGIDTAPPTIIAQTPAPNDTNIPLSISISVRFSEPVIGASESTLLLVEGGGPVAGTVTYFPSTRVARLTPAAPLLPNTVYAVKVTSGITDAAGNAVSSGVIVWALTTGA